MYDRSKIDLTHLNKGSPNNIDTVSHWVHFYSFLDKPLDKLLLPFRLSVPVFNGCGSHFYKENLVKNIAKRKLSTIKEEFLLLEQTSRGINQVSRNKLQPKIFLMSKYIIYCVCSERGVRRGIPARGHPRAWLIGQGFPSVKLRDRGARVSQQRMPTRSDILSVNINLV